MRTNHCVHAFPLDSDCPQCQVRKLDLDVAQLTRDRNELQAAVKVAVDALVRANRRCQIAEADADRLDDSVRIEVERRDDAPSCSCLHCGRRRQHAEALKARTT